MLNNRKDMIMYHKPYINYFYVMLMIMGYFSSKVAYSKENYSPVSKEKILIIASRKAGFFSNFNGVINNLAWCEKNDVKPYIVWDSSCPYWQGQQFGTNNAWEYYFKQPYINKPTSNHLEKPQTLNNKNFTAPDGSVLIQAYQKTPYEEYRKKAAQLIKKYIHIQPHIIEDVECFFNAHMCERFTIGIHWRGTDKYTEKSLLPPEVIFNFANTIAIDLHTKGIYPQFFIATDEERFLTLAKNNLNGTIVSYNAIRSQSAKATHRDLATKLFRAKMGVDILVEALLLSQCNLFLHGHSNVSDGVLIFNPHLEHIDLQYMAPSKPISKKH